MSTLPLDQRRLPGALAGIGVMLLAATAPIQIVMATKLEPSRWLTVLVAGATVVAGGGAIGAAYYSFHQARQAGVSRRAAIVVPVLQKGFSDLRELDAVLAKATALADAVGTVPHSDYFLRYIDGVVSDYQRLVGDIWAAGDMLLALGELQAAGGMIQVGAIGYLSPRFEPDDVGQGNERQVQQIWSISEGAVGAGGLRATIEPAREKLRAALHELSMA